MRREIATAAIAALAAMACSRRAEPPAPRGPLTVELNTNSVAVGQTVHVRARLEAPSGAIARWPAVGVPPAVVARSKQERRETSQLRSDWELIALRPGRWTVSSCAVERILLDGTTNYFVFPPLELEVRRTLTETNFTARDIAGLQRWPSPVWQRLLAAILAVAALALLAAGAVRLARRLKRQRLAEPPPPPPHTRALEAIARLRARGMPSPAELDVFFVELSSVVRRYLEEAFGLRAPEQTTEEFIRAAADEPRLSVAHRALVQSFLEQADLVKFARHQPQADDIVAALDAAERLVRETAPPAVVDGQAGAGSGAEAGP